MKKLFFAGLGIVFLCALSFNVAAMAGNTAPAPEDAMNTFWKTRPCPNDPSNTFEECLYSGGGDTCSPWGKTVGYPCSEPE